MHRVALPSLVLALCVAQLVLFQATPSHAVRRNNDNEFSGDSAQSYDDAPTYPPPPSRKNPPSEAEDRDGPPLEAGAQSEVSPEEEQAQRSSGGGFVPLITILLCSRMVPQFQDVGQMPVLVSVMLAPRVVQYFESSYGLTDLPGVGSYLLAAAISFSVFSSIVNVGSMLGIFSNKPAGTDQVGKPAASVSKLKYVQGEPVDVQDSGSVKIVEFWATWCPPCKKAIPHLNTMYKSLVKEFGEDKIQLVGITNEGEEKVMPFITEMAGDMEYPVALDPQSTISGSYPTKGIPHAYVVDKDGAICWSGHPSKDEFEQAIRAAVAGKATAAAQPVTAAPKKKASAKAAEPVAEKKPQAKPPIEIEEIEDDDAEVID